MTNPASKGAEVSAVEMKTISFIEVKDADKGEVEADFATLGVVDHEGDIIRAGAIKSGTKVIMSSYGHDAAYGNRPAGKGKVFIEGDKARFKGNVFMSTTQGRETFEVLKAMGPDQEWSFGFRVMGSEIPSEAERKQGALRVLTKLDTFEVSPVMQGAGINTRTVSAKNADPATPILADPVPDPIVEPIAEPVVTKAQLVRDLAAEIKAARANLAGLEAEQANAVAKEIFDRFRKNFKS